MYYQWTEDGECETCTRKDIFIDKECECYHCGCILKPGKAVEILTTDGERYVMHESCADKGCFGY